MLRKVCYLNPPDTPPDVSLPAFRKGSRKSRIPRKNPSFPFSATLSRDVPVTRCLHGDAPGIFIRLQNVPPSSTYEGRFHWALSRHLPSPCYFPVNVLRMSRQRQPNQQPFGALGGFYNCLPIRPLSSPNHPLELFWPANRCLGWEHFLFLLQF